MKTTDKLVCISTLQFILWAITLAMIDDGLTKADFVRLVVVSVISIGLAACSILVGMLPPKS